MRERSSVIAAGDGQAEPLNQTDQELRIADERVDDGVWRRKLIIAPRFGDRRVDKDFAGFAIANFNLFADETVATAVAEDAIKAFIAHEQVVPVAAGDRVIVSRGMRPALDGRADGDFEWDLLFLCTGGRVVNAEVICAG